MKRKQHVRFMSDCHFHGSAHPSSDWVARTAPADQRHELATWGEVRRR